MHTSFTVRNQEVNPQPTVPFSVSLGPVHGVLFTVSHLSCRHSFRGMARDVSVVILGLLKLTITAVPLFMVMSSLPGLLCQAAVSWKHIRPGAHGGQTCKPAADRGEEWTTAPSTHIHRDPILLQVLLPRGVLVNQSYCTRNNTFNTRPPTDTVDNNMASLDL